MDNQVQEVKLRTDIASIIGDRIEIKKAGRNYKANCPFHGEKTPSFMISPELQIFKCFGCSESGDVFSFLEKYEGMEFPEALKYLADRAGIKLVKGNYGQDSDKEKLLEINSRAIKYYKYMLLTHPLGQKALEYLLKDRGLKKETIEEFNIGFSPTDSYLLKKSLVEKNKFNPADIEKAGIGIVRGNNIYDRFNGRVVFPLYDHRGNPIGFSGRVLPWDTRETGKYINSPETPLYHKSKVLYGLNVTRQFIKQKKVAIVTEGELDMISSYQAGIKNVVAIKGSALTEDQVRLLSRFAPKFILALDADFAGDAASRRGINVAENSGVEVKVAKLSKFKDPDEAARKDLETYKKDLIHAEGVWDYLIDSVFARFNSETGEGKSKISKELMPLLAEIEDKIVQAHYTHVLADKLGVPMDAVSDQLAKFTKGDTTPTSINESEPDSKTAITRVGLLEERFVTLCFLYNPAVLVKPENESLIKSPVYLKIISELKKYLEDNKDPVAGSFDTGKFGSVLPRELFSAYSLIVLTATPDLVDKPDELKKELDLVKKELKILGIREDLKVLTLKMKELEIKGEKEGLLSVQTQYNKLAKSLASLDTARDGGIIFSDE
jgi:DNA primase